MSRDSPEEVQLLETRGPTPRGKGALPGGSQRGNGGPGPTIPHLTETTLLLYDATARTSSDTTPGRDTTTGKSDTTPPVTLSVSTGSSPEAATRGVKGAKKGMRRREENDSPPNRGRAREMGGPDLVLTVPEPNSPPAYNTLVTHSGGSPKPSRNVGRTFVMVGPPDGEHYQLSPMGSPMGSPRGSPMGSPLGSPIMSRPSRSLVPGGPRGRSRTPAGTSSHTQLPGAPAPERVLRSRSPTPTRTPRGTSPGPHANHVLSGTYVLAPPEITYDEVATAPNSPINDPVMGDIRLFGSSHQLYHNKAVMVTPTGSLLAVNQSPLELRESTLSVNYPDMGGKSINFHQG